MTKYVLWRLLRALFVIWAVSLVTFIFLRLSGDPTTVLLPFDAGPEDRQRVREAYGLDQPIIEQYTRFLNLAVRGDFGNSLRYRQPALGLVLDRYPNTVQLAVVAMLLALLIGIPVGTISAISEGRLFDLVGTNGALVFQSIPSFWLGIMLIIFFSVRLGWLPTAGKESLKSLILPAITLSATFTPQILLLVRSEVADALHADYVRTARAKGLQEWYIYLRHISVNALIPVVTVVGLTFGTLLGGAVVTETVFSWPGVGLLAVEGVFARDFPLVQASIFMLSIGIVAMNLLVDLLYGVIDPRIGYD